jgi:hypothetical protein
MLSAENQVEDVVDEGAEAHKLAVRAVFDQASKAPAGAHTPQLTVCRTA